MKKLLFLLLFIGNLYGQTTVNYVVNNNLIANPERGFYHNISTGLITTTYPLLSQATLTTYRTTEKISVIQRVFYLNQFTSAAISTAYLNNIQTDLNTIRNSGLKVIVRFAYSKSTTATPIDATKAIILQHIAQVGPILTANKDVIVSYQYGWIGAWGETYYSSQLTEFGTGDYTAYTNLQYANRKEVLDAMLVSVPSEIPVQVRYVYSKQKMYPLGNSRIGFYNDAFLNQWGDSGTFLVSGALGVPSTADKNYFIASSLTAPITGETDGINSPRTDCTNAMYEMNLYNWSLLNKDYLAANITNWQTNGCYTDIESNLGYKFELFNSTFNKIGNNLNININGINVGYSFPFKTKQVYFVFRNNLSGLEYFFLSTANANTWVNNFAITDLIDVSSLPIGNYSSFMWIPDANLTSRAEYCIQIANNSMWEPLTGYNNLNQTLVITTTTICPTTTWDGTSWDNGQPASTVTAIIDGPYDTSNDGAIDCCSLIVNSSLIITTGEYCNVYKDITINGSLLVKSGGSLIPVSDSCISTGEVTVERKTPSIKRYDYTYWGSPVNTFIGNSLFPSKWEPNHTYTFKTSNFYDVETKYQNTFISNAPDGQDDNGDAWQNTTVSDYMVPGKGYAAMIKSLVPLSIYGVQTVLFTGRLNTGVITIPIELSINNLNNNDDLNLVSNPYSAAINSNDLIDINTNLNNISGTLYFWTHTNTLSTTYTGLELLNFSVNDYAKYTKLGGITATFGGKKPSNVIGSCQGFLVEAENNTNLIFTPSLMSKAYVNSTAVSFFKSTQEKKVWLNINNAEQLFSQQLIGYNSETTTDYNIGWDSRVMDIKTLIKFYSIKNDIKYDVTARGEFSSQDVVKLGFSTEVSDFYTISIDSIVGIPNVYIKDNGVIHSFPYMFHTGPGEYNDRFELVYETLLATNIPKEKERIINITTYDVYGRKLLTLPKNQILIQVITTNKGTFTKKIVL